jgi:hypothetical protein
MIVLAKILGISAPLSAAIAVYFIFKFLDKKASGAATRTIAAWIGGSKYEDIDLKLAVIHSFESLYGPRILSLTTLIRSTSYSTFSLLTFIFLTKPNDWSAVTMINAMSSLLIPVIISDYVSLFFIKKALDNSDEGIYATIGKAFGGVYAAIIIVNIIGMLILYSEYGLLKPFIEFYVSTNEQFYIIIKSYTANIPIIGLGVDKIYQLDAIIGNFAYNIINNLFHIHMSSRHYDDIWQYYNGIQDYVKQNNSSIHVIYSILFGGMAPALIVHLWLPLFLLSAVLNAGLVKFFKAVRWAQWAIKRGAQHPLEAIGMTASVVVFILGIIIQMGVYLAPR